MASLPGRIYPSHPWRVTPQRCWCATAAASAQRCGLLWAAGTMTNSEFLCCFPTVPTERYDVRLQQKKATAWVSICCLPWEYCVVHIMLWATQHKVYAVPSTMAIVNTKVGALPVQRAHVSISQNEFPFLVEKVNPFLYQKGHLNFDK